jgi:ribokinase
MFPTEGFEWSLVDTVVLNEVEARSVSGRDDSRAGARTLLASGVRDVVLTLGRDGAAMFGSEQVEVPAPVVEAVDTTGAGDVFCGVLTAMRADGVPWPAALAVAARAAAIAATRRGVFGSFPSAEEIAAVRLYATAP